LSIYNVLGELVETIVSGDRAAGNYQVTWDASNVASGMYFYRLSAGSEHSSTRSLVVLK
jgi:flagellar hook assembly protein FlgD